MSHVRNLFRAPSGRTLEIAHQSVAPPAQAVPEPVPVRQENAPEFPTEEARVLPEARLVYQTDPRSPGADRFRYLRMLLRDTAKSTKLKKILVTSPLAGDGKSTVVLNLATALSELGQKSVLVVEADLHRASLATDLKLRSWTGL